MQGRRATLDNSRSEGRTPEKAAGEGGAAEDQTAPASNVVRMRGLKKPKDGGGRNEAHEEANRKISGELADVAIAQHDVIDNIMLDLAAVRRRNSARITEAGLDDDQSEAPANTLQRRPQRGASNPGDLESVMASVRSANVARQDNTT